MGGTRPGCQDSTAHTGYLEMLGTVHCTTTFPGRLLCSSHRPGRAFPAIWECFSGHDYGERKAGHSKKGNEQGVGGNVVTCRECSSCSKEPWWFKVSSISPQSPFGDGGLIVYRP